MDSIEGVVITPLKIIEGPQGNILHALKQQESSFYGFGEAYFSTVDYMAIKGWKKHTAMVLNIVVPVGAIQFVMYDARPGSPSFGTVQLIELSPQHYQRLTVPPGIWMAFRGMQQGLNLLLNLASIPHDPSEAENIPIENTLIPYQFAK